MSNNEFEKTIKAYLDSRPSHYKKITDGMKANMGILKHASRRKLKTA